MNTDLSLGYAGTYVRFDTLSKKDASQLLSADNLIGDQYEIVFKTEDGICSAWFKNRFGALVGYCDAEVSRQLQIYTARGWELCSLLSFVAYSDTPSPGKYWGEMLLICYDPTRYGEEMNTFIQTIRKRLQDSIRPDVELSASGLRQLVNKKGNWVPSARVPLPDKSKGMAILKRRLKFSERMIEKGREKNKGCYTISWIFIIVVVAALTFGIYHLLGFLGVL